MLINKAPSSQLIGLDVGKIEVVELVEEFSLEIVEIDDWVSPLTVELWLNVVLTASWTPGEWMSCIGGSAKWQKPPENDAAVQRSS